MIIHCPNCNARYTLTAQQIGPGGRTMRCAKCSHTWFQPPVEDTSPTRPVGVGKPPLAPKPKAESTQNTQKPVPAIALLVSGISLAILIVGGFLWWKLSSNTYTTPQNYSPVAISDGETNQAHSDTGLVLSHIEREIVEDDKVTLLLFRGRVTNTNAVTTPVPEIRVQLLNKKGVELDFWPAEVEKQELKPGEETTWIVRFLNPPLQQIAQYKAFFKNF